MVAIPRLSFGGPVLAVAGLALALVAVSACNHSDAGTPPGGATQALSEVGVITLEAQDVVLTSELPGRATAYETSEVRPQVSGIVQKRLFTEGQMVKPGEPLYQIDARLHRATVAQASADLHGARATETAATERAGRIQALYQEGVATALELAEAKAAAGVAEARIEQATAALDTARINLQFTRVSAPIGGRIGRSLATTGALVTAGQPSPLTTIQRLDPIFVDLQQSSTQLMELRRSLAKGGVLAASTRVELRLDDGSTYEHSGTLQFSEAMVDQNTGSVTVRVSFPNPKQVLLPGMYVRAVIEQGVQKNAILAPQRGILRDNRGKAIALVLDADDRVQQRDVTTLRTVGDAWLVQSGLRTGDRLIVEGTSKVKPGQTAKPLKYVPKNDEPSPQAGEGDPVTAVPTDAGATPQAR